MADTNLGDNGIGKPSAFETAFHTYVAGLQKKQKSKKLKFIEELQASDHMNGLEDIDYCIEKLQTKCERQGMGTKTKSILVPIISAIKTYSSILDVFVSAHPMPAALIWGSLRAFVEIVSIGLDLCEKLQEQMEDLKITIGRLTLYEKMYYHYPGVQDALGRSYVSILEFWYQAQKWCRARAIRRSRNALKAPASTVKIDKALDQLNDDAERLEKLSQSADMVLRHEDRKIWRDEASEASRHRQYDYTTKRVMRQVILQDWLGVTHESNFRRYDHFKGKRHPGSCQWLLRHEIFASWWAGRNDPSIIWVQGQPGAGKSVLCSAAIEEAKKSPSETAVAFLFLTLAQKAESIQLLRSLSRQLLYRLLERQGHDQDIPESLYAVLRTDRDDYANVKQLFEQLVKHLAPTYVFLDGLNEVEGDVEDILKSLIDTACKYKLRLWCSSQYTPGVKRALEGYHKLVVTAADTQDDIESYLSTTIPQHVGEGDRSFISKFQSMVLGDTEGCFLWASYMIEALDTAISEDERKMLILDRLPRSMDQYYTELVERLNERDKSGWHLVRRVLSIVTFAKRSLRVSELREAIAILRVNLGDNLSSGALPLKSKVIEYCSPLIECIDSSPDAEDGQIQLSHSLVRDFLRKHSDSLLDVTLNSSASLTSPKPETYVSSRTIAESCLRYLLQRRYSHLLMKRTLSNFDVSTVHDPKGQHLLLYAAEFWYHHYEDVEPTKIDHTLVDMFLKSLNFYVWIQVQNLYLTGGTQQGPRRDHLPEARQQILPTWFATSHTGDATVSGYQEYIEEWGHLLRRGILWAANAEIDRCFWGALGPTNCLSKAKELERYPSFMFVGESGSNKRRNAHYTHAMSYDGRQLMLAVLETDEQADEEPARTSTITLERWDLDGDKGAFMEQKHEFPQVPLGRSSLSYSAPDPQAFTLIPEISSRYRPAVVAFSNDLRHMRLGTSLWSSNAIGISTDLDAMKLESDDMVGYWEEIASRDSVIAHARRRAPRQESRYIDGRKILDLEDDVSQLEPTLISAEDLDLNSQGNFSIQEEVHSLLSGNSETVSQSSMVSLSDKEDYSSNVQPDLYSDSDTSKVSDYQLNFSDVGEENETPQRGDPMARTSSRSSNSKSTDLSQRDPFEYEEDTGVCCNVCRAKILVHYMCSLCSELQYVLCEICFDAGKWCLDTQHALTKKYYGNQQRGQTVSYDDLALVQDLMVLDTSEVRPRQLYRFSRKSDVLMFDSPPVFHPTGPIVVWLLGRDKLLLGNFKANSSFIHPLPSPKTQTHRILACLQISPCGFYLHIISFETPAPIQRNASDSTSASRNREGGLQTSVRLMTFRISDHDIQEVPTLILSVRFNLSPSTRSSFKIIPFAVTWQLKEAYITVSDSELNVYKVSLFPFTSKDASNTAIPRRRTVTLDDSYENLDDKSNSGRSYVSILLEPLLLPSSAQDRSVQFFPPPSPDQPNVTLIIGPRLASSQTSSAHSTSTPPIAIYLPPSPFFTWTPLAAVRKSEISSLQKLVQPLGGKFEDLGPGEELDLIRYRTLDGGLQSSAGLEDYNPATAVRFEIRYVQDLELAYGMEKMLMRRVDVADGERNEEGDGKSEQDGSGEGVREERKVFKTRTGAAMAVLKAGVMEERAKMSWFFDYGPAEEIFEIGNFNNA